MTCPTCGSPLPSPTALCSACGALIGVIPQASEEPSRAFQLKFHGDGLNLFGFHALNMVLIPLTLGIYYFWGKVNVRKYFYSETEFDGERFAYHGTGLERFMGALRVGALFVGLGIITAALTAVAPSVMARLDRLIVWGFWLAAAPYAIVASRRYRLSRTSLRGIRFGFRGALPEFYKLCLTGGFLTLITLGCYGPFFQHDLKAYMIGNSYYGSRQFRFDGQSSGLLLRYLKSYLLSIVTLGIYSFWFQAWLDRYFWDHTSVDGARFQSSVTGGGLFSLFVTNSLITVLTLGIGLPWATARNVRYKLAHLKLVGNLDLDAVRQEVTLGSATGDDMADLLGVDLGL